MYPTANSFNESVVLDIIRLHVITAIMSQIKNPSNLFTQANIKPTKHEE